MPTGISILTETACGLENTLPSRALKPTAQRIIINATTAETIIAILKLKGGLSLRVGSIIACIENAIGTRSNAPNVIIKGCQLNVKASIP